MKQPLASILLACLTASSGQAWAGADDGRLDIYWIDVEGGAATLIVTPKGESVLIDTGNPGHRDPDRIAKTAVEQARLRQLDHVIITHYHSDHFGGAATLNDVLPIKHLHDNGIFEGLVDRPDPSYLAFKAGKRSVISPGDELELAQVDKKDAPRVSIKCLGTRQKYLDAPAGAEPTPGCAEARPKPVDTTDNSNSVVTLLKFGRFEFFDSGDLTWNLEKELVCPTNRVGTVDVYQTGHHGLDASNHPLLVRALQPIVAVINNGATKGCEPATFAALKATPSVEAIYQVHRNVRNDGSPNTPDEYIANPTADCKANYIKLSVDPTGATFVVSIPATGHAREFLSR